MAGWPLQMGDIQAQVAVGDINGDGYLELVAADARGNVAAFTWKAQELWERHVASLVSQVWAAWPPPPLLRYGLLAPPPPFSGMRCLARPPLLRYGLLPGHSLIHFMFMLASLDQVLPKVHTTAVTVPASCH